MRPEYLAPLREELANVLEEDETGALRLTARSLREAHLMDSFIREVMRLKGDTISAMRYTTCDVPLGNVIIHKGAYQLLAFTLSGYGIPASLHFVELFVRGFL